jgi:hypothetical protein
MLTHKYRTLWSPEQSGVLILDRAICREVIKFLNLATGDIITRRKWTELPVPSEVVLKLEELSSDPNDEIERILENKNENEEENENEIYREEMDQQEKQEELHQNLEEMPPPQEHEADVETIQKTVSEGSIQEGTMCSEIQIPTEENVSNTSMSEDALVTSNTQSRYDLRPNRTPNYLRRFAFLWQQDYSMRTEMMLFKGR